MSDCSGAGRDSGVGGLRGVPERQPDPGRLVRLQEYARQVAHGRVQYGQHGSYGRHGSYGQHGSADCAGGPAVDTTWPLSAERRS
jgi:hypothetical protein